MTKNNPIIQQDIESELSYAYLHAVVSMAGGACQTMNRLFDKQLTDATVKFTGDFEGILNEIDLSIQLKSTKNKHLLDDGFYSYSLDIQTYDKLRQRNGNTPMIFVVLFLSEKEQKWLQQSEKALVIRDCAYWVSLKNAPPISGQKTCTIYIPKRQIFDVENLKNEILKPISKNEELIYENRN